jgi:hypothetical protein
VAQGPQCNTDERKIPAASCDRAIPATECLAWHVQGRIPGAKLSGDGRVLRFRCPNHDDGKPSAVILVGDGASLVSHCHACGKDAKLEVRAAIIRAYGIDPKCLPLSRQERVRQEGMLEAVFTSPYTPCTRLVCVRAILDGMRGPLPPAPPLVELGKRAGVSRSAVFRARQELAGGSLDHLFVPAARNASQAPQVTSAIHREVPSPSLGSDVRLGLDPSQRQSQSGTGSPDLPPAA